MGNNLKRVVIFDGGSDSKRYLMLTEDQIRLLSFMVEHSLFYEEVTYTVLDDQEWETI